MIAFSRRRTLVGTLPFLKASLPVVPEEIDVTIDTMSQLSNFPSDGKTCKFTIASFPQKQDEVVIPIDLRPKWASHWTHSGTEEYSKGIGTGKSSDFPGGPSRLYLNRRRASLPPNADIIPPARFANRRGNTPTLSNSEDILKPVSRLTSRRASLPPNSEFLPGQSKLLNRRGSLPPNLVDTPSPSPTPGPTPSRLVGRRASLPNPSSLEQFASRYQQERAKSNILGTISSSSPGPQICVYDGNSGTTEHLGLSPRTRRSSRTTGRSICSSDGMSSEKMKAQMITLNRSQTSPRRKIRPVTPMPSTCASTNEQITSETVLLTPKPPSIPSPRSKEHQTTDTAVLSNNLRQPHMSKLNQEVKNPPSEYIQHDEITDINANGVTNDLANINLQFQTDETKKYPSDSGSSSFVDSVDEGCIPDQGWIEAFKELNPSVDSEIVESFRCMTKMQVGRILNWLDDVDAQNTRTVRTGNNSFTVVRD